MKNDSAQKVAIYSRKSKFTGKGESIENQIELCRQYINVNFTNIKEDNIIIYEDEGFSGGNIDRPRFKQMMSDAKDKKILAVVCYRLDRISRNIGDFAKLIEELNELKVSFISIKEQFDTSSPMGRAMMYIASVFSQLERETIAERIRDNMHELSKTGRWLGGNSPIGYASESIENVTVDGKIKKACKLKLILEESKIVKLIFDKFLETNSLTKTETYLIQNSYVTKNNKLFTRFALRNILANPVYMIADTDAYHYLNENNVQLFADQTEFDEKHGVMAYNRTIQKPGKANRIRPMNEWIVSVGKHTGIIRGADWVKAQQNLWQNKSKSFRKSRSNVALLSGLLYCTCGDYMRPKLSKRLDINNELIYSYVCSMKEKSRSHCCKMKNANGNMLDKAVCEEIKKLSADSSEFISQLEKGKRDLLGNREEYDATLERLKKETEEHEKEIQVLVSSLVKASGTSAEDYIMKQISQLHERREILNGRITELEQLTTQHELSNIEFDILRNLLSSFKNTFDEMSVEQKRAALRTFIRKITWDGKNVNIYFFGSDGKDIEYPDFKSDSFDGENAEPMGEDSK